MALEQKSEDAKRYDGGKLRWDLLDWRCIKELVKVYTFGSKKYTEHNWRKGMSWSRTYASLQRHIYDFWVKREMYDKESGAHHLAHAAWNCFTLMWYSWFRRSLDDRVELEHSEDMAPEDVNGMPILEGAADDKAYVVRHGDIVGDMCSSSFNEMLQTLKDQKVGRKE